MAPLEPNARTVLQALTWHREAAVPRLIVSTVLKESTQKPLATLLSLTVYSAQLASTMLWTGVTMQPACKARTTAHHVLLARTVLPLVVQQPHLA